MDKKVLVSVSGLQTSPGSRDTVEVINSGEYFYREGKHYLRYEEQSDETSNTMDTQCIMKLSPEQIELTKKGDIITHMVFEQGKTHLSQYSTQFGDIMIGTTTNSIQLTEQEHELLAELVYSLEVNDQYISECHLTVSVSDQPDVIL